MCHIHHDPTPRRPWRVPRTKADLGGVDALLHRIRLMSLTGPAHWEDPHFPDRGYRASPTAPPS
ncbi:hypothetical protein ACFH04_00535 [Streptomyces noboritoensis]|uniref:Uncharacterized protein n=1 Tax=Streptomyces noboritoensis TaxID=67337 RepID=A0ABV6T8W2_9ACTN